ncbi:MAG TPA: hypothetical protein VG368_00525 [Acidimicrobiales bacterium]|nr:hypothetical protein [Acidimicrobiales bacterium]
MPRAIRQIERIEFGRDDVSKVTESMKRLADARDGWINLVPKIVDREPHSTSLRFFTLFGGGGSGMTMGTWIPGSRDQRGPTAARLGITHVMGRRLLGGEAPAVQIPTSWSIEQDHPRRGLVAQIPLEEALAGVLEWTLRTITALTLPDRIQGWRADVYLPFASKVR